MSDVLLLGILNTVQVVMLGYLGYRTELLKRQVNGHADELARRKHPTRRPTDTNRAKRGR